MIELGASPSSTGHGIDAILTVPVAEFHAALSIHFPEIPDRVLQRGAGMRVGALEQARLRRLLHEISEAVRDCQGQSSHHLSCRELEGVLLPEFIAALRSGCSFISPPLNKRTTRRHRRLREARDFLEAHQREPIHINDLCSATKLSERGVENLFQDLLGIGPTSFLRCQRLNRAHRALLRAAPATGKVKEIALEAGFWHQGHFARNYLRHFGEKPSETLARTRTSRRKSGH